MSKNKTQHVGEYVQMGVFDSFSASATQVNYLVEGR